MLLLVTCFLFWSRMAMPICAVTLAKEFGWSKTETGMVLGAYFWGYCFTQVLGGHASDRWVFLCTPQVIDQLWQVLDDDDDDDEDHCFYRIGGERVLLLSTPSWAVMTAITPLLANTGLRPLVTMTVTRFLLGAIQGESTVRDSWGVKGENCEKNEGTLENQKETRKICLHVWTRNFCQYVCEIGCWGHWL